MVHIKIRMASFFISEFNFAEKLCDRNLLKKYPKKTANRAQVIIGEIIAADYDYDVDWSKVPKLQKKRLGTAFTSLLDDLRSNTVSKRGKLEGLSKVRAFLSSVKYPKLFPGSAESGNDDDDSDKR